MYIATKELTVVKQGMMLETFWQGQRVTTMTKTSLFVERLTAKTFLDYPIAFCCVLAIYKPARPAAERLAFPEKLTVWQLSLSYALKFRYYRSL